MSLDYSAALEQFYQQHQPWLLNYLQQGLSSLGDAEDLCQQVFLQLCVTPELLVNIDKPRPWLAAVANRLSIDLWRKKQSDKKRAEELLYYSCENSPTLEQQQIVTQELESVAFSLQLLPDKKRHIFIDARIYQFSRKKLASDHGISLRTVSNYLRSTDEFLVAAVV